MAPFIWTLPKTPTNMFKEMSTLIIKTPKEKNSSSINSKGKKLGDPFLIYILIKSPPFNTS